MPRGCVFLALIALSRTAAAQELTPALKAKIDEASQNVLAKTGVPSAELGIVQNGRIVYTTAYGNASLQPKVPATSAMHYAIGSISKQFTAACVLFLQQEGKLKLDDPVANWFPEFTDADKVTIRNLLTHTSGYSDYAPQDYTIPDWVPAVDPLRLVHEWATKPLDFAPGTKYQYSNTNFVIAGLIVQKVSGTPFWDFLQTKILEPLKMKDVLDLDRQRKLMEPVGYMRYALGPPRPAILEGPGWYFADGQMAMPVRDLLTWDISVMNQSLLSAASYFEFETEHRLKNGVGTGYGLGIAVGQRNGRRTLSHSGEVGGFVAANTIYPDDKMAIAVLTNQEASSAASGIAHDVADLLFGGSGASAGSEEAANANKEVKAVFAGLQRGELDRSLLSKNCNFYFSEQAIADYRTSLGPLGSPTTFELNTELKRGGMTGRFYDVKWPKGPQIRLSTYWMPDGKIEQFLIEPQS